jgi:hypothetical protein
MHRRPLSNIVVAAISILALILIVFGLIAIAQGDELQPWAFLPIVGRNWPTPTRSPYPFAMADGSPSYTQNFANNNGCNWLGVAGQVFDLDGDPVPNGAYMIWVPPPVDYYTLTGLAPAYGPSGWEIYLHNYPLVATYHIQLFTPAGTPVSEDYEFATVDSCDQNLVLINFVQNH